jgi:hypothetical protein
MEKLCSACMEEGQGLGCFFKHMRKLAEKQPANGNISRSDILREIVVRALDRNCPHIPKYLARIYSGKK